MIVIPKTLHYVWLGENPMPELMLEWQQLWRDLHPSWEIKIWRPFDALSPSFLHSEGEIVECRNLKYLSLCPTYAKRSDVWRYEILEQLGGVYLDTDMEPVKSIEPLLEEGHDLPVEAFAGLCETNYHWQESPRPTATLEVGCSIMGAIAHHPWLVELVNRTPWQDPNSQISLAFPYLTEITGRHPEVRLFEPATFYPFTWDHYAQVGPPAISEEPLSPGTYAVHRWSSTWFADGLRQRVNG
jgi:mannosyltransferase OCH1-like enzyme